MRNRVSVSAEEVPLPEWAGRARSFVLKTLKTLRRNNWDVSVLFCSDDFIAVLNRKYRRKDEPTDVLSFQSGGFYFEEVNSREAGVPRYVSGDIVISLDTLNLNSEYFSLSRDEELRRLLIHGILHLAGFDHSVNDINEEALAAEPMLFMQESILNKLNTEKIIY